jgi:hypothetical protein
VSVAGVEFGDGASIALGIELGHRSFGEVVAVASLPFVIGVGEDGADEADQPGLVREDPDNAGAKNEPLRSFGMCNSMSPAWVATRRGRESVRSVTRVLRRS